VPSEWRGRLLDVDELGELERLLARKKPAAPSVRRRQTKKREASA
jgi:hypothetical protein